MNEDSSFCHGHYVYVAGLRRQVDGRGQVLPERQCLLHVWGVFLRTLPPDAAGEPGAEVFNLATREVIQATLKYCQLISAGDVRGDLAGFRVESVDAAGRGTGRLGKIVCSHVSVGVMRLCVSWQDGAEEALPLSAVQLLLQRKCEAA